MWAQLIGIFQMKLPLVRGLLHLTLQLVLPQSHVASLPTVISGQAQQSGK